jgi:hypothetical protein
LRKKLNNINVGISIFGKAYYDYLIILFRI